MDVYVCVRVGNSSELNCDRHRVSQKGTSPVLSVSVFSLPLVLGSLLTLTYRINSQPFFTLLEQSGQPKAAGRACVGDGGLSRAGRGAHVAPTD